MLVVPHDTPGPILRLGVTGGFHITSQWSAFAFVQVAKVPGLSYADVAAGNIVLIPYEPLITGGVALVAHFGGPHGGDGSHIKKNPHPELITVIEYAELTGAVTDDTGKPV